MKLEPADIVNLTPAFNVVVRSILKMIEADQAKLTDRIGYPEREAAALLGIPGHVLGDARRRGEIEARRIGKRYVYGRASLLKFLEGSR